VVPAHDEEERLDACLVAIHRALAHPAVRHLPSCVVVVLDDCRDDSARIAAHRSRPQDRTVIVTARNVGIARSAGVSHGLAALGLDPASVWLGHTDADSTVPRHWLARQLALARSTDAVAGVVRVPDWSPHRRSTRRAFDRSYRGSWRGPHPHVHGANLGVRASAYLLVGGFPALACSEDHALWDALRAAGHVVRSSRRVWVATSARRRGRAPGGFADTLERLAAADTAVAVAGQPSRSRPGSRTIDTKKSSMRRTTERNSSKSTGLLTKALAWRS